MTHIFQTLIDWYLANLNFWTVSLFMAIESTFIPFPSEVIIPPAAYKAATVPELLLVILAGILGSCVGALINYSLAVWLGRPLVHKFADTKVAHLLLINSQKVEKAEQFFIRFGRSATFIGRLVPGVRHLISIPAGLAKMKLGTFLAFTALGSGLWSSLLAVAGYLFKGHEDQFRAYYDEIGWGLMIVGVAFVVFIVLKVFVFAKKKPSPPTAD